MRAYVQSFRKFKSYSIRISELPLLGNDRSIFALPWYITSRLPYAQIAKPHCRAAVSEPAFAQNSTRIFNIKFSKIYIKLVNRFVLLDFVNNVRIQSVRK